MNSHPSDDELLALIDGGAKGDRAREHLSSCARCGERHAEFEATLALAGRVPEPEWTALQGEAFVQSTHRRLWSSRPSPDRRVWQPALGGALLTGAVAAVLVLLMMPGDSPPALAQTPAPAPLVDTELAAEEELGDEQLMEMIETYLVETASADELLLELDELSDDEYYALLEE